MMPRTTRFFSSTRLWMMVSGILLVALVLVSGTLIMTQPPVNADTSLGLAVFQAKAAPALDAALPAVAVAAPTSPAIPAQTSADQVALAPSARALAAPVAQAPIQYTGDVQANNRVPIAVEVIGQVLQVNVEVGDQVKAGDVLLQINSTTLEAQRAQALAGLEAAQAQLDGLLLAANKNDVAAAQAGVDAATAAYEKALAGPTKEDLEIAESQLRQAEAAVTRAQAAYDRQAWNPAIAALPESQALEQATLQVEAAKAQYQKIQLGATQDVRDGLYAQVVNARANLDRLQRGPTQPQIDAVRAQVRQAETGLYLAQLQVDKSTLRAPVDGVVSAVNTAAGANVAPGAPVFELLSKDVKVVVAVDEARLADVRVGQAVKIRVNAYPDRTFDGTVSIVAPQLDPSTRAAQVTIRPSGDASLLAPGMFATVEFGN